MREALILGALADGYKIEPGPLRIKTGCRWFTTDDAKTHWKKTRGGTTIGNEHLKFISLIENYFSK